MTCWASFLSMWKSIHDVRCSQLFSNEKRFLNYEYLVVFMWLIQDHFKTIDTETKCRWKLVVNYLQLQESVNYGYRKSVESSRKTITFRKYHLKRLCCRRRKVPHNIRIFATKIENFSSQNLCRFFIYSRDETVKVTQQLGSSFHSCYNIIFKFLL